MSRASNDDYINKLRLTEYYSPDVISLLDKINKYDGIDIPYFCSRYLKDRDTNTTTVRCELVQYVADNSLHYDDEILYACEDLLNSMETVDDMLAVIGEGVKIRDIMDYNERRFKTEDITGADVIMALAQYMQYTGKEVHGLKVIQLDEDKSQLYHDGVLVPGNFTRLFSVDIVDGIVAASIVTDSSDMFNIYNYYLGDPNGFVKE